jgi:hypothetical protein
MMVALGMERISFLQAVGIVRVFEFCDYVSIVKCAKRYERQPDLFRLGAKKGMPKNKKL